MLLAKLRKDTAPAAPHAAAETVVRVSNVVKDFGSVRVLDSVSFERHPRPDGRDHRPQRLR